uniref:Uncharacterized protein n=1 Tax=Candidatus Kentrum sp. LFY TaxID=2126342 RepID=A0A450WS35_9GAMM|nr:MAG: hypothetical protein BECKLFY1418C_GA0070996_106311 [Candidatus Kentron sp. LFY]
MIPPNYIFKDNNDNLLSIYNGEGVFAYNSDFGKEFAGFLVDPYCYVPAWSDREVEYEKIQIIHFHFVVIDDYSCFVWCFLYDDIWNRPFFRA